MQITRDDDFGGAVLNCAVRYALGRSSYMPGLVMGQIKPMLPDCSDNTLAAFEWDVSEYLGRVDWAAGDAFGRNLNNDDWARFLEAVRAEMERRKGEDDD